jgi:hypothetical protein
MLLGIIGSFRSPGPTTPSLTPNWVIRPTTFGLEMSDSGYAPKGTVDRSGGMAWTKHSHTDRQ